MRIMTSADAYISAIIQCILNQLLHRSEAFRPKSSGNCSVLDVRTLVRHRNRRVFTTDKWVAMATAQCDGRFTVGWANSTHSHRVDPLFAQPADRRIGFYNLSDSFKPDLTGRSLDTVA